MTPPLTHHRVQAGGLSLHYVRWGGTDRPPILLVHGGRDHARTWDRVARKLAHEFTVYAIDLRGHGDSDWATGGVYNLWDYVTDLDTVVRAIPSGVVGLVGHSMGGAAVLQFAGARPGAVSAVVAIEPFGAGNTDGASDDLARLSQDITKVTPLTSAPEGATRLRRHLDAAARAETARTIRYASREEAAIRMREANPRLDAPLARHLARFGTRRLADGGFTWKFDNRVRGPSPWPFTHADAVSLWSAISAPTMLVYGADSGATRADAMGYGRWFQDVTTTDVAGASHYVHHDDPAGLAALIRRFTLPGPGAPDCDTLLR